jgi:hypothetical protein
MINGCEEKDFCQHIVKCEYCPLFQHKKCGGCSLNFEKLQPKELTQTEIDKLIGREGMG